MLDISSNSTYTITGYIDNFSFNEKEKSHPNPLTTAPELFGSDLVLHGLSSNHSKFTDGELITTSAISEIKNGLVFTQSGSCYKLLNPNQEYVEYCNQNNVKIFPDDKKF